VELKRERELAEAEIHALAEEAIQQNLHLEPFLWEKDAHPVQGQPQITLNEALFRAEHVVVLLWKQLNPGTREEMDRALEQAHCGVTDTVGIYFKNIQAPDEPSTELVAFHQERKKKALALTWKFATPEEFVEQFRRHLRDWLHKWYRIMPCCRYALEHSPPMQVPSNEDWLVAIERNRFWSAIQPAAEYLGRVAVDAYQNSGPEHAVRQKLRKEELDARAHNWRVACAAAESAGSRFHPPAESTHPLVHAPDGGVHFHGPSWFCFFAAVGLAHAIKERRWEAVAKRPYFNDIHQYLAGYARNKKLIPSLAEFLRTWLTNADGSTTGQPVVRNFAAYVLGMFQDYASQHALFQAYQTDSSPDVRKYSALALGKLRSRFYLAHLVERFDRERDENLRLIISQAVCNIVGVRQFPL
jgi:hypothetical protein